MDDGEASWVATVRHRDHQKLDAAVVLTDVHQLIRARDTDGLSGITDGGKDVRVTNLVLTRLPGHAAPHASIVSYTTDTTRAKLVVALAANRFLGAAAQLGGAVLPRGGALGQPGGGALPVGDLVGLYPSDADGEPGGHRLGPGVGVHVADEVPSRDDPAVDLIGQAGQQLVLENLAFPLLQQDALVLPPVRDPVCEGGDRFAAVIVAGAIVCLGRWRRRYRCGSRVVRHGEYPGRVKFAHQGG